MTISITKAVLLGSSILMSSAFGALAAGHGAKTIGQTTALIAEAGLADITFKDGAS